MIPLRFKRVYVAQGAVIDGGEISLLIQTYPNILTLKVSQEDLDETRHATRLKSVLSHD